MKLRILFKSFDKQALEACFEQYRALLLSKHLKKCKLIAAISLPEETKKFCVIRSPHIDKDSREQYEFRIYKKFFDLLAPKDLAMLDQLLAIEVPSGVAISLVKYENE